MRIERDLEFTTALQFLFGRDLALPREDRLSLATLLLQRAAFLVVVDARVCLRDNQQECRQVLLIRQFELLKVLVRDRLLFCG